MSGTKNNTVLILVEGALMIALATALSFVKIFQLPWGGSVTLLSMLPIVLFSIRRGVKAGLLVSFVYALIQFAQGAIVDGLFGWGLTAGSLIGCIMFDYILAFTVLGLAGFLRKKKLAGWIIGIETVILIRFFFHLLSGTVIFHSAGLLWDSASIVINVENSWLYSAIYNGAYMLPEMIFTILGAVALFQVPAIRNIAAGKDAGSKDE